MSGLGVLLAGIGVVLIWAGFTATALWPELAAVLNGQ